MMISKFVYQLRQIYAVRAYAKHMVAQNIKEGGFYRRQGRIYLQDLEQYVSTVSDVPGAFAEIGIRYGNTFRTLIPLAKGQNKPIYAIDSFQGTKQSSSYDGRPDFDMSVGGVDVFLQKMRSEGFLDNEYQTLVGWIPDVFDQFPGDITFSFVILDVDNYTPTVDSLNFVWPRMSSGGILFCDDFCTYHQMDAGRALREFLRDKNDYWLERVLPNYQIVLRKA